MIDWLSKVWRPWRQYESRSTGQQVAAISTWTKEPLVTHTGLSVSLAWLVSVTGWHPSSRRCVLVFLAASLRVLVTMSASLLVWQMGAGSGLRRLNDQYVIDIVMSAEQWQVNTVIVFPCIQLLDGRDKTFNYKSKENFCFLDV